MKQDNQFKGFSESKRGYWFTNRGTTFLYYQTEHDYYRYYLINEQEEYIIRMNRKETEEILYYSYYCHLVDKEEIEWLIDEKLSKYRYFDSFEQYKKWYDKMSQELESEE